MMDVTDENEVETENAEVQLPLSTQFTPRAYQIELFKYAREKNSILVLGTGSGKTFIAMLLIQEFAHEIRGSICKGSKRTVFVVNTVTLVGQQGSAIEKQTGLKVGQYEGSKGVDNWSDKKWDGELEKHEVIVITAQIFLDLILHARLPLRRVNLLIMDECHHAVGSHPMREIMREYGDLKRTGVDECPRILGLTASVINKKCKKEDVSQNMHELEQTMDCALVTSVDPEEALRFTTRPDEKLVIYNEVPLTPYREMVEAQLGGLLCEVEEQEGLNEKVKKNIKKSIMNIKHIMGSLGDWCVARAIYYEKESLEESAEVEEVPVVQEFLVRLRTRFEEIYDQCVSRENLMGNPKDHVSHQALRLIEILVAIKSDEVAGLIFVERRNTAKILYDFLLELAKANEDLNFIKPLYVVGANTRPGIDLKLAELELRKQKKTLDKFRDGQANFIVSTSVLEEGVDIRKCNAVIRFDKPANYRAYVQSRGRARAVPSKYILMVEMGQHLSFINDLDVYREIEKTLLTLCHNRGSPTAEEIQRHFNDDLLPPYEPYGKQGPKVTANSAISLINHYIGKLPQDRFTTLAPDVKYENFNGMSQAVIVLPTCSNVKEQIRGTFENNKELAKKSAALHLCKILHRMGELDHRLRPTVPSVEMLADDLLDLKLESSKAEEPNLGTKKHRQIYRREVHSSFRDSEGTTFYLYSVEIHPTDDHSREITVDSAESEDTMGIMCKRELVHCPFKLYGPKIGEVIIKVKHLDTICDVSCEMMRKANHFHKLALESILPINKSLMEFDPKVFDSGLFIVPLKDNCINFGLMDRMALLSTVKEEIPVRSGQTYEFDRDLFENAVVFPLYGDMHQMHYVTDIKDNLNPRSEFPECKMLYENYEGYFLTKYGATITNRLQPLISVKHLPKELNYLKKVPVKKKGNRDPQYFIPELCGILPFRASLWWHLSCAPSVLYRLNSFGVAHKLSLDVGVSSELNLASITAQTLDFSWTERVAQSAPSDVNLAVALSQKKTHYIYPFMLAHALTLMAANDGYNLEGLEVLGDAFLKYVAGEYVYLKFPDDHEGKLSPRRTLLVRNKTLFQLAKRKAIPRKIQAMKLQPRVNGILPGFGVKKSVERELREIGYPSDKWHKLPVPEKLSDLEQVIKWLGAEEPLDGDKSDKPPTKAACFNPWEEHEVSDKSIADCTEALIGAYLLQCGADAAKDFLHWMGIGVHKGQKLLKDNLPIKTAIMQDKPWSLARITCFYKKACLDRLEDTIQYKFKDRSFVVQAVTHPSYTQNKITNDYQRLEFIGDAVLDYLVTGLIYSRHTSYTPGQMTDLRSYCVNNETLARAAAKHELQKYLLHMSPKLQAAIDKFLQLCQEKGLERALVTEDEEDDVEEIEVPKSLGDLIESIIGAVYLDSNRDLEITWNVVSVLMGDVFQKKHEDIPMNPIRLLYEISESVQFEKGKRDGLAMYKVKVNGKLEVIGLGKNFKVAKVNAAKKAIRRLQEMGS
ncbi:endoribonuclease Dicer-like [Macrobrachium rosenbergii]|uniref:endoribonuclease Dicer-like n=1 Tax=Macrobrachium rosenbergii TaxID=79674 RepID=UPI0034D65AF1